MGPRQGEEAKVLGRGIAQDSREALLSTSCQRTTRIHSPPPPSPLSFFAVCVLDAAQVSKEHLRVEVSAARGLRLCDLGSKHGAVITKPAPSRRSSTASTNEANKGAPTPDGSKAGMEKGGKGGKDPASSSTDVAAKEKEKPKFFPIPIPRDPEWVAGAHGDLVSLGKTTLMVERKDGPKPPPKLSGRRRRRPGGARSGVGIGVGAAARRRKPATVISKVFELNPNLVSLGLFGSQILGFPSVLDIRCRGWMASSGVSMGNRTRSICVAGVVMGRVSGSTTRQVR